VQPGWRQINAADVVVRILRGQAEGARADLAAVADERLQVEVAAQQFVLDLAAPQR
jgi:hypothetical protein